jgi:hypothetical protein
MSSPQQKIGRITGLTLFSGMIAFQLYQLKGLFSHPSDSLSFIRWGLITTLFALFLSAYVIRRPAVGEARGLKETLLPLFCAGLPFAIIMVPPHLYDMVSQKGWTEARDLLWDLFRTRMGESNPMGLVVMAIGEIITIGGMLTLRGSFSIFSEARKAVFSGLYRWVRHPLYTGEIISLWGWVLYWPSLWSLALTLIFTITQSLRAKVEEAKLIENFPDYADYRKEVGFLLPKLSAFLKKSG